MEGILLSTRTDRSSWTPPVNKILAYFHGGRIFTETLPTLARAGLVVWGLLVALWWIGYWGYMFLHYERWSLVLAALAHFGFLALAYLFGRIAWLRLDHLRHIPPGETSALRSLPILLRFTAEGFFFFVVAFSFRILVMPGIPGPEVLEAGGALNALGQGVPNPFAGLAVGVGTLLLGPTLWALLALVVFYGLANAIETYLAIEQNTRNHSVRKNRHGDLVRQAGE